MNKDINAKLNFLTSELKRKVFIGVSESYNNEITDFFKTHPTGVGVTLQHFKPLKVDGNMSKETIAIFDKGYPALLQMGTSFPNYPYNKKMGTFVSFAEEPDLEKWAKKNYKGNMKGLKGLFIGKEGRTAFGEPHNRWVDISLAHMKSNSQTRRNILREIKQIKLK